MKGHESAARSSYWDNWKGIAIVAVVIIHSCGELSNFSPHSLTGLFGIGLRQAVNFAVPIFLAIAGFFAGRGSSGPSGEFYRKRLTRILAPYLVWTTIYLVRDGLADSLTIRQVIKGYLFGTGIGIGYFVIVLIQFTLLTPFIKRLNSRRKHFSIMLTMTVVGVFFTYYFPALHPDSPLGKFPAYALPFFVWYPFFHLGIYVSQQGVAGISFGRPRTFIALAFAFAAAGFIEGYFWILHGNYGFGTSQLKLSSILYSTSLFLAIAALSRGKSVFNHESWLAVAGRNSYAIYLIHMMLLIPLQQVAASYSGLVGVQPLYILISASTALIACLALALILRRLLPQRVASMVLG
jgi:surface polysaccharide O-acyltransferase-like enzyme